MVTHQAIWLNNQNYLYIAYVPNQNALRMATLYGLYVFHLNSEFVMVGNWKNYKQDNMKKRCT